MISNTGPIAPAVPAESTIFGGLNPSNSTSSFADQLASVVSQPGSNPNINGTPRQNSDTQPLSLANLGSPAAAGSPANASGSATQLSFFQYLIDTPSAASTPSSMPSAAGIHKSGASDSRIGDRRDDRADANRHRHDCWS